jgi:hypothetical protein
MTAHVPGLTGLVARSRGAFRRRSIASPRLDLHLTGMQEIRNGFFPRRNVFVTDGLFASIVFAVVGGRPVTPSADQKGFVVQRPALIIGNIAAAAFGPRIPWSLVPPSVAAGLPITFEFIPVLRLRATAGRLRFCHCAGFCRLRESFGRRFRLGTCRVIPFLIRRLRTRARGGRGR